MSHAIGQGAVPGLPGDGIAEVMYSGVVLDKENRADSDWLCLMCWFEFMRIWCDEVSTLWSAHK